MAPPADRLFIALAQIPSIVGDISANRIQPLHLCAPYSAAGWRIEF
jgi:hypothetical protein